ncbi:putative lipoprotein [Treponema primitia ZAS-2]|uniref:Putative lipoprotein n=1 Tax=Treponema primitia (strain ATCC BAA-887 / DSM 12427 / ZAS-2) TaxID=545694 RepID=F5YLR0_TREPZ|nr:hypothetical protein [Treponema primitia]AEF84908.1 putative lipoprotein [Treponema primitia ZAS-2]
MVAKLTLPVYGRPLVLGFLAALLAASCDLSGETDILAVVDQKVWEASAPRIAVSYSVENDKGFTIPAVSGEAKQKIPFTVTYTPLNQDWAFTGWTALDPSGKVLASRDIYFEEPNNSSTQVIILTDTYSRITLKPVLAERPLVWDWHPNGGTDNPVNINTPVVVRFTKPMRVESFVFRYDAKGDPVWRNESGEFRNITILGSPEFGTREPVNYAPWFLDPQLNGDTLKLEVNLAYAREHSLAYSYISVTLGQEISSADYVTLSAPVRFQYAVNDGFDTEGPVIRRFSAALPAEEGEDPVELPYGNPDHPQRHLAPGAQLDLIISALDQISLADIRQIEISEKKADGSAVSGPITFWYTEDYQKPEWQTLIADVEKNYGNLSGLHIFRYEFKGAPEYQGYIDLQADVYDPLGNFSTALYRIYQEGPEITE